MRGVQLTSDEEMLPDSQRGFAPVIRGIAKSNAEVTVEQNNYVIYRTFVQPGAFEINDLYPTSNSGDLTVTIKESDGSEQKFVQPFSSVALLQREGHLKYSLSAGEYRAGNYNSAEPKFGQLDAMYGLPYGFTVYGGAIFSDDYYSLAGGLGKNFGYIGAISIDVTCAKASWQMRRIRKVSLIVSSTPRALTAVQISVCWVTSIRPAAITPSRSDGCAQRCGQLL